MPIERYDRELGDARKVYRALAARYGRRRGRTIFYALIAQRRRKARGGPR